MPNSFKIISGGQTGVDRGALLGAADLGLATGGTAPRGWITENGPDREFMQSMGMHECAMKGYPARTERNVRASDGTLIIARNLESRGTALTIKICEGCNIPWFFEPFCYNAIWRDDKDSNFQAWLDYWDILILNVAGHRESNYPGIEKYTTNFIKINLTKRI